MFRRQGRSEDGTTGQESATPPVVGARARVAALRPLGDHAAGAPRHAGSGWVPGAPPRSGPVRMPALADIAVAGRAADGGVDAAVDGGDASPDGDRSAVDRDASRWKATLTEAGPWGAMAEKWVPEPLRGARINPGRRGAALLSIVAALAAVVAAVGVWWSRPAPTPIAGAAPTVLTPIVDADAAATRARSSSESGAAATASTDAGGASGRGEAAGAAAKSPPAATAESGPILVSVTGNVHRPGLVTLAPGARVADAIAAAGGAIDDAELTGLNLAARLSDGGSVVVAGNGGAIVQEGSSRAGAASPTSGGMVNLNTADTAALQTLAGVGPVTAAAIVAYRTDHGAFTDIAQLEEVAGIGPATLDRLRPHVTL